MHFLPKPLIRQHFLIDSWKFYFNAFPENDALCDSFRERLYFNQNKSQDVVIWIKESPKV